MLCTAGSTAPLGLTDGIKSSLSSFGDGSDSVIHSAGNIGTNTAAATAASAVAWICVTTQDGYIKVQGVGPSAFYCFWSLRPWQGNTGAVSQ